jgi:nucleoside phosphorylase/CheY-like chemotaxis protein
MSSIRILIVEDDDSKFKNVQNRLLTELANDLAVDMKRAADYESALKLLWSTCFDFVILDLLIPGAGLGPSSDISTSLLHKLMKGDLVAPSFVIGLTQYPDKLREVEEVYREYLLALEVYSETETAWAERISRQIRYMVRARFAALKFQSESYGLDVLVITARHDNEFIPVRDVLYAGQEVNDRHPLLERQGCLGEIRGRHRAMSSALLSANETGLAPTTALLTQAVSIFRPRLVAMLGMCCGFEKCCSPRSLGDVVISREISLWDEIKYREASETTESEQQDRSKTRMVDDEIREVLSEIVETKGKTIQKALGREKNKKCWEGVIKEFGTLMRDVPDIIYSATVSGSSLVADSDKINEIVARNPTAVGLEMENYGVYTAIDFISGLKPSKLAIKGVADYGDRHKKDAVQRLASTYSAITLRHIIDALAERGKL